MAIASTDFRRRTCKARTWHVGSTSRPGAAQNALKSWAPATTRSAERMAPTSRAPGTCHAQRRSSGEGTVPLSIR